MIKKVYTEKDIYEGMVLECVSSGYYHWIVGNKYIVEGGKIRDEDGKIRDVNDIVNYLNNSITTVFEIKFKVIEPEEKQGIVQLFKYTFGLKTGDAEEITCYLGNQKHMVKHEFNKKHITIPAYNTQQAIEYLTNELEYDINDIVSLEVK